MTWFFAFLVVAVVGALFAWLDSQHHEHGAQPWSALREALTQEWGDPYQPA